MSLLQNRSGFGKSAGVWGGCGEKMQRANFGWKNVHLKRQKGKTENCTQKVKG